MNNKEYLIINNNIVESEPIGNRRKLIEAISQYTPINIGDYYSATEENIDEFLEYHEGITSFIAETYIRNEDGKWNEVYFLIVEGSRAYEYSDLHEMIKSYEANNM